LGVRKANPFSHLINEVDFIPAFCVFDYIVSCLKTGAVLRDASLGDSVLGCVNAMEHAVYTSDWFCHRWAIESPGDLPYLCAFVC
jgi:hypothetical protein